MTASWKSGGTPGKTSKRRCAAWLIRNFCQPAWKTRESFSPRTAIRCAPWRNTIPPSVPTTRSLRREDFKRLPRAEHDQRNLPLGRGLVVLVWGEHTDHEFPDFGPLRALRLAPRATERLGGDLEAHFLAVLDI